MAFIIYLLVVQPLVIPHNPLRADEKARVTKLGGFVTTQLLGPGAKKTKLARIQGQLSVSRAIGDAHLKRWVPADPEIVKTELKGDEHFVVIASDGLWDVLSHKDVGRLVRKFVKTSRQYKQKDVNRHGKAASQEQRAKMLTSPTGSRLELGDNDTEAVVSSNTHGGSRINERANQLLMNRKHGSVKGIHGCARYLIRTALSCGSSDNISVIVIFFKAGLTEVIDLDNTQRELMQRENESHRGLFSGVGLFNRARIRRVFARTPKEKTENNAIEDQKTRQSSE